MRYYKHHPRCAKYRSHGLRPCNLPTMCAQMNLVEHGITGLMATKTETKNDTTINPNLAPAPGNWEARELYDIYRVTIGIRDKLCGGMPKNPELLKGWIAATTEHDDETTTQQEKEAREAILQPTEEKSWNGFPVDEHGLFVWSRQVKALFKECASMLRITVKKTGSKQIFQHGFEIKGPDKADRVYMTVRHPTTEKQRTKPNGYDEGPIHVQTAQGPRTALKRVDYVTGINLTFDIWVLKTETAEKRHVGEEELRLMLTFGQENGLGADRSQGHGKFDVIEFQRIK